MSIRWKLFITAAALAALLVTYLLLAWMPRSLMHAEQGMHRQLEGHLDTLAEGLVPLLLNHRLDTIHGNLDALLASNPDWVRLELTGSDGSVLYPLREDAPPGNTSARTHSFTQSIEFMDTRLGQVKLIVDEGPHLAEIRAQQQELLAMVIAGVLLFAAALWLVVEMLVRRPAVALGEAARRLAQNDFQALLPERGNDEIGALIGHFAAMREEVYQSQQRLRQEIEAHQAARQELHREMERAEVTLHSIGDAVIVTDCAGKVEFLNPVAERLTGWSSRAAAGRSIEVVCRFRDEKHEIRALNPVYLCLESGRAVSPANYLIPNSLTGQPNPVEASAAPIRDRDGRLSGAVLTFRDVTALRQTHRSALSQRDTLLRTVVGSAPVILFAVDPEGRLTFAEGHDLTRWGKDRKAQLHWLEQELPQLRNDIQHALTGHAFCSFIEAKDAFYEIRYTPVLDDQGRVTSVTGVAMDISERRKTEQRLNTLAYYDTLTRLPNRALFLDRLNHAMTGARRRGERMALMFLDLDRFKVINDTLGHEAGDLLLEASARRIGAAVRKEDTLARLGGDEFTVILENVGQPHDAGHVAAKIIDGFAAPFRIHERELFVSPSIGITFFPDDATESQALLRNADTAMYHAKEQGRNNYQFYSREMTTAAHDRLTLENDLRAALERDDELFLLYQPQIDCASGAITGIEALARWHHPQLGILSPQRFIPIAEDAGLIHALGEWVLRTACRQCRVWLAGESRPLRVAVNVSARQLHQGDFPRRVHEILEETGLDGRNLELELTESTLLHDSPHVSSHLKELKIQGINLALDDFGTGYSSLSYLKRFPIDKLKIDQSFVRDIGNNPDASAIVSAIIAMGRTLRLKVVAEGVERKEQMEYLSGLACHGLQGYFYYRELPGQAITPLLRGGADHRDPGRKSREARAMPVY